MAEKDRVHGSLEVLEEVYRIYKDKSLSHEDLLNLIKTEYPSFAILYSFYEFIKEHDNISLFLKKIAEDKNRVEEEALKLTKDFTHILTYSRSSQVKDVLLKKKGIKRVYITEARPHNEGILLGMELAKKGIPVKIGPDAALEEFIKESDAIVIGADAVFTDSFINKIGTGIIVKLAEIYKKPVFVLAIPQKKIKKAYEKFYKIMDEPPDEILKTSHKNIEVFNRYFERVYFSKSIHLII